MKNKQHTLFIIFSLISILALAYCLLAYRYLQPLLNVNLVEHTSTMKCIELLIIPALILSMSDIIDLYGPLLLIILFFLQLTVFSGVVSVKSNGFGK